MESSSKPQAEDGAAGHAYPRDLALYVHERWSAATLPAVLRGARDATEEPRAPDLPVLERLLSVAYQASLLYEEGRPITFRLALAEPDVFPVAAGPPGGLQRLVLTEPRPFDAQELRRLARAASFYRSLIGVRRDREHGLQIWGVIHSGPRWLQVVEGGRDLRQAIPLVPLVAVTGPGRVLVGKGPVTIGKISGGAISGPAMNVFDAPWLQAIFAAADIGQGPVIAQHVLRRVVAAIRSARHGGTVVLVPSRRAAEIAAPNPYITFKYAFCDEEPRRRVQTLIAQMTEGPRPLTWNHYEESADPQIAELDEAVFEVAHLIAALADVDGATVVTSELEVLGFGGEISGALADVPLVARARDLEGDHRVDERTDRVGTRHRSVYRLCQALHDVVAIVVSQDGGVRFVRWHDGAVTYWDQIATGPWEI